MNPAIEALNRIKAQEASMTEDERNDRREGYADGTAMKLGQRTSRYYDMGYWDGIHDWVECRMRDPRPLSLFWRIYARIARLFV